MKTHSKFIFSFLQYFMWRVAVGLHHNITYSFLPVGHTKFSPDWCFGLVKQKFRHAKVDSLQDLVDVVESSASVNSAQLVGTQDGEMVVPIYDWQSFLLTKFRKLPGIKKFHNFKFSSESIGEVIIKEYSNSLQKTINLLRDPSILPSNTELPTVLTPTGLSPDRQWYLYDRIREFCPDSTKDLVCPLPSIPRYTPTTLPSTTRTALPLPSTLPTPISEPPQKRQRICGKCGRLGHNMRTCGVNLNLT